MEPQTSLEHHINYLSYTRENLMLGSFVLHAQAKQTEGFLQCPCDHNCKYFILNEERKLETEFYGEFQQRQVFEESRNKGYPEEITRLVQKEDIQLLEFLREIYSMYRHLEIAHKVFAELIVEIKFSSEEEIRQHWLGWGFDSVHFSYEEQNTHYAFTITVKRASPQDVEQLVLLVGKTGFEEGKETENARLSENECIVFFSWLLTSEDIQEIGVQGCKRALESIKSKKSVLQGKVSSIRRRSLTRLYDLSSFY